MAKPSKTKVDKEKQKIVTPEFRVSYPHVFKTNSIKGSKPKYSVTMLFKKSSDLSTIKEAIKNAKIAKYGPNKSDWPEDLETPVLDGDSKKYADKEGYKGHWAIKASTGEDQKPGVYGPDAGPDGKVQPITDPSEFYPGCYAKAYVYAYVWDNEFGQGVGFILDHVQKIKDGKSFGGKKPGDQVFTPVNAGRDEDGDDDFSDDADDEAEEDFA